MKSSKIEIKNKEDVWKITSSTTEVTIKTKPSLKMISMILDLGDNVKKIKISKKLKKTQKKKVWEVLKQMDIEIKEYDAKLGRKEEYKGKEKEVKKYLKKLSIRKIAKKLNIPKSSIHRIIKRIKEEKDG